MSYENISHSFAELPYTQQQILLEGKPYPLLISETNAFGRPMPLVELDYYELSKIDQATASAISAIMKCDVGLGTGMIKNPYELFKNIAQLFPENKAIAVSMLGSVQPVFMESEDIIQILGDVYKGDDRSFDSPVAAEEIRVRMVPEGSIGGVVFMKGSYEHERSREAIYSSIIRLGSKLQRNEPTFLNKLITRGEYKSIQPIIQSGLSAEVTNFIWGGDFSPKDKEKIFQTIAKTFNIGSKDHYINGGPQWLVDITTGKTQTLKKLRKLGQKYLSQTPEERAKSGSIYAELITKFETDNALTNAEVIDRAIADAMATHFAAFETSSGLITTMLVCLGKDPEMFASLQKQYMEEKEKHPDSSPLAFESVMKTVTASLAIDLPTWLTQREVIKPVEFDGYQFSLGTNVTLFLGEAVRRKFGSSFRSLLTAKHGEIAPLAFGGKLDDQYINRSCPGRNAALQAAAKVLCYVFENSNGVELKPKQEPRANGITLNWIALGRLLPKNTKA